MIAACFGSCSLIWMPATLVAIGLNSPRISAGAPGFRSYMSMWLGPPACQIKMTDFRGSHVPPVSPAFARCRSIQGSVSPPRARLPTLRNDRRDCVVKSSIESPLVIEHELLRVHNHPQYVFERLLLIVQSTDVI